MVRITGELVSERNEAPALRLQTPRELLSKAFPPPGERLPERSILRDDLADQNLHGAVVMPVKPLILLLAHDQPDDLLDQRLDLQTGLHRADLAVAQRLA